MSAVEPHFPHPGGASARETHFFGLKRGKWRPQAQLEIQARQPRISTISFVAMCETLQVAVLKAGSLGKEHRA